MNNCSKAKTEDGFTKLELLIVTIIIGILGGIAAPSFLGMLNRAKVDHTLTVIKGALREGQREAIRKSRRCSISLNSTGISSTDGCLSTGDRTFSQGVNLSYNSNSNKINYGIRGTVTTNKTITVYYQSGNTIQGEAKCLVISTPLGIIRKGVYQGDPRRNIDGNKCQKS